VIVTMGRPHQLRRLAVSVLIGLVSVAVVGQLFPDPMVLRYVAGGTSAGIASAVLLHDRRHPPKGR
jgi:hypothetical protein